MCTTPTISKGPADVKDGQPVVGGPILQVVVEHLQKFLPPLAQGGPHLGGVGQKIFNQKLVIHVSLLQSPVTVKAAQ